MSSFGCARSATTTRAQPPASAAIATIVPIGPAPSTTAVSPGAIFAFSDEMACAFVATLQRLGFSVPGDVSVVGFDDLELVSHLNPALTTIRQPKRELGKQAARVILDRIEGRAVAPMTLLEPQLMLRETTARV